MAEMMRRAVQRVSELHKQQRIGQEDDTGAGVESLEGGRAERAELAEQERRQADEMEGELRGLQAEISAAMAALQNTDGLSDALRQSAVQVCGSDIAQWHHGFVLSVIGSVARGQGRPETEGSGGWVVAVGLEEG